MKMCTYRMRISYDGSRYEGWQRQARTAATVQGKLEAAFAALTGEPIQVVGAGRTDGGVHARGQTGSVRMKELPDVSAFRERLNARLPDDISVDALGKADDRFHARFCAKGKRYRYRIRIGGEKDVFERKYVWQYGKPLDVPSMKAAADLLTGRHDFTSFCGNRHMKKSAVRTLSQVTLTEQKGELVADFVGDGFLWGMVRVLMGTLVEVGEGKRKAADMMGILMAKRREEAGFTAPPQGLTLMDVYYEE